MDYEATVVSAELQDIVTVNSISTVSRVITQTQQIEIPNNALDNVNFFEVGAFLQVDLDAVDNVVYIADTAKFDAMGQLLIGNEMVEYGRKLNDRFLNVLRGRKGTTAQFWAAGTFMRQVPELVSVASVGVVTIESESDVTMVSASASAAGFERSVQREIEAPADFSITREALEVVITPPPGGVVDGYEEQAFIVDPTATRAGNTQGGHDGEVDLIDVNGNYFVTKRDTTEIQIFNSLFGVGSEYIGQYTKTNAGHTISFFDGIFNDGAAGVSALTIQEFDFYFPAFTLKDFTDRGQSSYTLAGPIFNLVPPSIQNPVAISSATGAIAGNLVVQNTNYFPTTGYLFTSAGTVIQYTGKTQSQFEGCTVISGPTNVSSGDELIPYAIS